MQSTNLNQIFSSLSDETRRGILERLTKDSPLTVSEIAKPYRMSLPAISKHLNVLEKAELVKREKMGREIRVRILPGSLKKVLEYLEFYKVFWNKQFDLLEKYLEERK